MEMLEELAEELRERGIEFEEDDDLGPIPEVVIKNSDGRVIARAEFVGGGWYPHHVIVTGMGLTPAEAAAVLAAICRR